MKPALTPNQRLAATLSLAAVVVALSVTSLILYRALNPRIAATPTPTPIASATPDSVSLSAGPAPAIPLQLTGGFVAHVFAAGLPAVRDLTITLGGTLIASRPGAGLVVALPDADHNGASDSAKTIVSGLKSAHGLAFHGSQLFVAGMSAVNRYNWDESTLTATFDKTLFAVPEYAGHTSRTLSITADGKLYLTVASSCNVCREANAQVATIWQSDVNGTSPHVFATGLRNAAFSTVHPTTSAIWATENSRDLLGDDLPPDEINVIKSAGNYGWPICYGNAVHDTQFDKATYVADPCASTTKPAFNIQAHSAPLGLTFINSSQFPKDWQGDLLVAYHGSWNRSIKTGYKLVRLNVEGEKVTSQEDFITGFTNDQTTLGRPVKPLFDTKGNLYLSDDFTGSIYIIQHPTN